ncbi:ABC transporter substrate binding protein [Amphritea sp. HPY]|uniref:ABC transporter substrate binding protein n=1 Tax=Amphritea sp. HPY TaxID=3421652 RepID=UPI003D7CC224
MMKQIKRILTGLSLILLCFTLTAQASSEVYSSSPQGEPQQRWRIAYYQGGGFDDYYSYLAATIDGLIELGWIEPVELPDFSSRDSQALWLWVSQNVESERLEFVADGYYSADWDARARREVRNNLISRLNHSQDIDMVFAMGTWAGQDLANHLHRVPVVVISTSDPLRSGIISSLDDSGFDHLFASYDPGLLPQQIQVFHKLIGFKRLGVPFENTVNGRSYAAMDKLEQASIELGFEIVPCYTQSDIADQQQAEQSVVRCFEQLVHEVDAIYVSVQGGINARTTPTLVSIANRNAIPTFSQNGEREVRYGWLLSLARRAGVGPEGVFLAQNIGRIINGAKPRNLNQVFEGSSNVLLNMKTAEDIGLYLNAELLAAADKLYWQIEQPE